MARDPGLNTVTTAASEIIDRLSIAAPHDPLANPGTDDLIAAALALWPSGPAWGSPDGQAVSIKSVLAGFTRVLLDPFLWLYARGWKLALEASVQGVEELLLEWEVEYGLPDDCGTGEASVAERLRALAAKVDSLAATTPGDFIRVAASYGFEISIEEPAIFECGFSECGGEHTVGDIRQETYWIVHIADYSVDYFTCGLSECGHDPLFGVGDAEMLLCILRKIAPAWTTPVLA